jgi:flagellin
MTRINTNINSLTAQQNLAKTGVQLSQALTRLSTGLRINSGKDDPAGMIAAAQLGSDIAGTNQAISNSKMGQMILDTADSALGQITSLVNDIRTLVTQAANSAAMSPDQIAANQLQIDSSLDAINRISQTTNFQGRKLLDGSLDFTTTHNMDNTVSNFNSVQNLEIDTADFGLASSMAVNVNVTAEAQKAYLATTTPTSTTGGFVVSSNNGKDSFSIVAPTTNPDNYDFANTTIKFASDSNASTGGPRAVYDATHNVLTISVNSTGTTSAAAIGAALASTSVTTVANGVVTPVAGTIAFTVSGATTNAGINPLVDSMSLGTAKLEGGDATHALSYLDLALTANSSATAGKNLSFSVSVVAAATSSVNFDSTGNLTLIVGNTSTDTVGDLLDDINTALGGTMTASINSGSETATVASLLLKTTSTASGKVATSDTISANPAKGTVVFTGGGVMTLTANDGGTGGNIKVNMVANAAIATTSAQMVDSTHMLVTVGTLAGNPQNTVQDIANAISRDTDFTATAVKNGTWAGADASTKATGAVTLGAGAGGAITFTAKAAGLLAGFAGGIPVVTRTNEAGTLMSTYVSVGANGNVTFHEGADFAAMTDTALKAIFDAVQGANVTWTSAVGVGVMGAVGASATTLAADGTNGAAYSAMAGGTDALKSYTVTESAGGTALTEDVLFMATGNQGSHLFDYKAGTLLSEVSAGINQWSDGTGISSRLSTTGAQTRLILESTDFGSTGVVRLDVRSGGANFKANMVDRYGTNILSSSGTNIEAKVNGVVATGDGNTLSIDTPSLSMQMTVNAPTTADPTPSNINFTITGGGAHFQIGPNVVSTQKAVIGIQSVNTANMNTIYGRLYQLHSGQDADLSSDANMTLGGKIITAVAGKIATLRGRLGAFSKTTMETNIQTLGSTVNALTNAQSQIQDADFAAETAALTRAQVLTQSGTSVLQIANRGPQNVLALLQNL